MAKLIEFNIEARRGLEAGMNTLADAVKVGWGRASVVRWPYREWVR